MLSRPLVLILYVLMHLPIFAHATSRCEDYLQVLNFPNEYAAPALESKINEFKAEPRDIATYHFDELARALKAEIERLQHHHLVADNLYHGEFTGWDALNPLNKDRKAADISVDRIGTYITDLVYYHSYVLAASTRLREARGATGFTWFDWYWGYPRSRSSEYMDDVDSNKKKKYSGEYLASGPESLEKSIFIGNQINSFGISHESIQTDFSSGDSSGFSNSW